MNCRNILWAGKIFDVCSCHEGWQSCSFAVDPSAQPRRMIQQNKQTLQYPKAMDKCMWVSIYTELKESKQHSSVTATKSEATPWLPSGFPPVSQSTGWKWPGPGWWDSWKPSLLSPFTELPWYASPCSPLSAEMVRSILPDITCLLITAPINHNCPLWRPLSSQNYTSKCQASLYRST